MRSVASHLFLRRPGEVPSEKLQEYKQQNPGATREDIAKKVLDNRAALRQRVVNFLTPEQLAKWDTEVAKAKEFLGHKIAA